MNDRSSGTAGMPSVTLPEAALPEENVNTLPGPESPHRIMSSGKDVANNLQKCTEIVNNRPGRSC
jgi:hypothetical protein